jgi:hypothetical protein
MRNKVFEEEIKHPSFGMVGFSRVSIGGSKDHRLFGSPIRNHMSSVMLRIYEGVRYNKYGEDHYFPGKQIIEVELSSAQFAELLTTMNVGSGVPCTIRWKQDEGSIEEMENEEIEIDRTQTFFQDVMKKFIKSVRRQKDAVDKVLEKKSINKTDREMISSLLRTVVQEIESNWPFAIDQFNEASERIVNAAKSEVDSFVTGVIQKTGLEQLKALKDENGPKLLKGGCDEQD